jgi:RNA polymerase sigma-70 factor (ECF subfamily)
MLADKREELFRRWLAEHKILVFKIAKAYAASPQDQDDLFQEILLQLWSSIPAFEGRSRETTWIYRVALNTALVWKRTESGKRKRYHRQLADFGDVPDVQHVPDRPAAHRRIVDRLYAAVRELPKIEGSIVLMYLDGLEYRQMAEILGLSTSNVGVKLHRAKKQLANMLKELVDDI